MGRLGRYRVGYSRLANLQEVTRPKYTPQKDLRAISHISNYEGPRGPLTSRDSNLSGDPGYCWICIVCEVGRLAPMVLGLFVSITRVLEKLFIASRRQNLTITIRRDRNSHF